MKLPKGWKVSTMNKLGAIQAGRQKNPKITKGVMRPYLRVANVQDGWIDDSDVKRMLFTADEQEIYELQKGDILLTEGQSLELVGRPAIYHGDIRNCCFQNTLIRLRPQEQDATFCYYLCQREYQNGSFRKIAKQTTSIAHLGVSRFAEVAVYLPPLPEQRKIAEILGAWDDGLEKLDALIAAKDRRKKGLMQRLLRGKRRAKGFKSKWATFKLGKLFSERVEQNRDDLPLLAITADRGIMLRDELSKRDTSSEDKSRYLRIVQGDIGYNTMRMWQGVSALSSLEGIISPAYTVCVPSEKIGGRFAAHFFKLPHTIHLFRRHSQGLVDDTLNLKYPNFATIEVRIPTDVAEQRAIADILDACDDELRLLREQRAAAERQKRGLMQRLLTGKTRVTTSGEYHHA